MAGDASAVLATRDMIAYYAPFATTNAFPADTINYGAPWGAPWVDVGFTDGGITANVNINRADVNVDQLLDPVLHPITGRSIMFSTNLAQNSALALQLSAGMGAITSLAPVGGATPAKGHDTLVIAGSPIDTYRSWGFEARQQNGEPFRAIIWKAISTGSPSPSYGQADTKAMFALEVSAVPDTSVSPARIAEFRNVIPALP